MNTIIKYPRTCHIEGSRVQAGDENLPCIPFSAIQGKKVVLEEKVDGANTGISFDPSGKLLLQSRGHYLNGGFGERQFDLLKSWAGCYEYALYQLLGKRYIMYGEWLYAKHTVYYDCLPHYFMEFDIYDKETNCFLSTENRRKVLQNSPFITSVLVLYEGTLNALEELTSYLGRSAFKSNNWETSLREQARLSGVPEDLALLQTDSSMDMEGIYIKTEEGGRVVNRMKFVRSSFLNTILESETHWVNRPIIPNQLCPGVDLFAASI